MDNKARIKVIKRGAQQPKTVGKNTPEKAPTAKSTAREMVATVTDWVTEFQQKRREETQETLHKLFNKTPDTACGNC